MCDDDRRIKALNDQGVILGIRSDGLERRLDDLMQRLGTAEYNISYNATDLRSDFESTIEDVRNDLKSLEHKVDYS